MNEALIWIVVGFVLIVADFVLASFVIVFIGLGAMLTGIAVWLGLPGSSAVTFLFFATTSVVMLFALRSQLKTWFVGDVKSGDIDDDFIGRDATVVSGFDEASPARGRVNYRGADWDATSSSQHLAAGTLVRIVARQSAQLTVEQQA